MYHIKLNLNVSPTQLPFRQISQIAAVIPVPLNVRKVQRKQSEERAVLANFR